MSDGQDDPMHDFSADWSRLWTDMAAQTAQAWQSAAGPTASPEVFSKGRAELLKAWSDWCENWMRSPAFIEAQKKSFSGALAFRKQVRENLRRMQRELQLAGADDISALAAAIRRSERRILDQLEETSDRVAALESKIDRLCERIEKFMDGNGDAPASETNDSNGTKAKRKRRPQADT